MNDTGRPAQAQNRRLAAVTALAVAAYLLVQEVVAAAVGALSSLSYVNTSPGQTFQMFEALLIELLKRVAESPLSFGVGVFVAFGFLTAISGALPLRQVILRGLLATAVGCGIMFVVSVLLGFFIYGRFSTGMFGASFPGFMLDGSSISYIFIDAVGSVARAFVSVAPIVVLAGVFQWMWCGRRSSVGNRVSASETGTSSQV
jgi:hypothetical protein